ncbi:patatin-like phospholipase family protein [Rhodococcus pyridinivorans]|uniref:patatin-like phospholipase family protein n=1 Tax=Rhodococcus pyridinivorans TaxID=103816 RepID=UPI002078A364|nr:patatin-like phospholipase family protein [Rhodococcus pyridinivorans]USI93016.1 patatin-like phospholipase family protein [Rhodococcus pyridinivorans]
MKEPRIGLALSGGGFRATAFGLGCLRALHDRDLLRHVRVVSGISGGSLLAAMWAYGPESFDEFDETVTSLLRSGLQLELLRRAAGPKAIMRSVGSTGDSLVRRKPRSFNRTNGLISALDARGFGRKPLEAVTHADLATVITATDLNTMTTMRFGSGVSSNWKHGDVTDSVSVSDAVAASAAFPLLLPPVARTFTFTGRDGHTHEQQVVLTDGGVYENLGLSPLLPGRDRSFTSHVYDLDYLIVSDAGRGKTLTESSHYFHKRLKRTFDITYEKSQDGGRSRLHEVGSSGQVRGIVHSYLAQRDDKLPVHLTDLVPRAAVVNYPTNFAGMSAHDLAAITIRGEQLTRVLLAHYCPELGV